MNRVSKVLTVLLIMTIVIFMFLISTSFKGRVNKYKDKGYVYMKQIVISVHEGKENRTYLLGLQDPYNPVDKGFCEVDSYTYQFYPLCSYYPYNLWGEN